MRLTHGVRAFGRMCIRAEQCMTFACMFVRVRVSFRAVRVIQCKRKSNLKGHERTRGNLVKLLESPSHKFHSVAQIWVQEKYQESCPVLPNPGCPDGPLAGLLTLARKCHLKKTSLVLKTSCRTIGVLFS